MDRIPVSSCSGTGIRFLKSQSFITEGGDGLAVGDEDHCFLRVCLEEAGVELGLGGGIE